MWQQSMGIPGKAVGGPCTFVHLTMFHPSLEALADWTLRHGQNKRDAKSFGLTVTLRLNSGILQREFLVL